MSYTTSSGAWKGNFETSEALEILCSIMERRENLSERERTALSSVQDLVVNHHEVIDDLDMPAKSLAPWPVWEVSPSLRDDPNNPRAAIRILIASAEAERAEKARGQKTWKGNGLITVAIEKACDFLTVYGRELDSQLRIIPMTW